MSNYKQIEDAINKAWPSLPDQFRAWQLWTKVQKLCPKLDVYQDTILHAMRTMNRKSGYKMYECINRQESLYEKQTIKTKQL